MKKIFTIALSMMLMLSAHYDASAQGLFGKKKPLPNTRGKANVKDLAKEIHSALLAGNADRLLIFVPTEAELKELKKESDSNESWDLLAKYEAKQLDEGIKKDLEMVRNQLTTDQVSPSLTTITEVKTGRVDAKTPAMIPVIITLADPKQKMETLTFDALRINKRVYLFRQLQVKSNLEAINTK